jgi:predicted TIM-barrel fold metal-dependent hydrolase
VIDFHVHIGPSELLSRWWGFEEFHDAFFRGGLLEHAVVMPNVSKKKPVDVLNDEFLEDFCRHYNHPLFDVMHPFLMISPYDMGRTFEQIHCHQQLISGIKYHPSYCQVTANDSSMALFWEAARELDFPVLVHCGRNEKSHIKHLILAAQKHQDVTFIGAHLGGNATELVDEALGLLQESDPGNVMLDVSAIKLPWLVERAVGAIGADRILYGSDEPYADIRVAEACVEWADISERAREMIFHENARRLLGIDEGGDDRRVRVSHLSERGDGEKRDGISRGGDREASADDGSGPAGGLYRSDGDR